jgi:kinesin family protein C1
LRSAEDEIDSIRLTKVSVEKELHGTKIELDSLYRSFDELQTEYELVSQSTSDNREAEMKLEHLTTEHIATSAQLNAVCADLAATKARAAATITAKEEEHKNEVEQLHFEMSVLKTRAGNTGGAGTEVSVDPDDEEDKAVLKARLEERDRRIAEMEVQLLSGEALRRQMHNRIQELRGNIRVFVRTRPFLPNDGASTASAIDVLPDGEALSILDTRSPTPYEFKFDKVFPPSSGQDTVFQEVADFVQSALDGYHVCLFSYGQTGSGKTHTMQGSGNGAMRGIIPRAVEQILQQAQVMQSQKWNFTVSASFLEIYNEDLKDLLVSMKGGKETSTNPPKLSIKRSREGKSFVDGLSEVMIDTREPATGMHQLEALMGVAARSRSVASTKMNSQSSRSHSVFMLNLHGYNEETGAEVSGALNLCDLAGSERLDRSGASSDAKRLRETQAINKSLSCLGDVFNALATGASHVPYRNSKLTYLLQDCLSGDGKALMFVNLSPTTASSNESLCSLRFAQRVNQVELGKPTKHIQYNR